MKCKVYTNESFDNYILKLSSKRDRKFEDRWDSLDFDDVTPKVDIPSDSEVNAAVRELDLFDDVAAKTGAQDVEVGSDGKLRLLDLDDAKVVKQKEADKDARAAGLDLDDKGKTVKVKDDGEPARELDLDDGKEVEISGKKSNVGAIGSLDYDDDIDTSRIAASIADVYTALKSDDPKIVKAMIKRYAADIKDENEIKEVLLNHAIKLNLDCLRAMCGDMKVVLTAKEKNLGFIDRADIKEALDRFKKIAAKLTGDSNTYGLMPNAIVSCNPEDQIKCINIIDFLKTWVGLPIVTIYYRGAMVKKCYDLAKFLYDDLGKGSMGLGLLTGHRGLLTRIKQYDDVPKKCLDDIAKEIDPEYRSNVIGDFWILCANNKYNKPIKNNKLSENKLNLVLDYIDDNDMAAMQKIEKILKLK
jgi:hypothetical protein